jgi:hypothetical protein
MKSQNIQAALAAAGATRADLGDEVIAVAD